MTDHSWTLDTNRTIRRYYDLLLLRGMGLLIQAIPIYLFLLTIMMMFLFDFFCPRVVSRYLNACNEIDNHNRNFQSDIVL